MFLKSLYEPNTLWFKEVSRLTMFLQCSFTAWVGWSDIISIERVFLFCQDVGTIGINWVTLFITHCGVKKEPNSNKIKVLDSGARLPEFETWALSLPYSVTLWKLCNFSVLHFPHYNMGKTTVPHRVIVLNELKWRHLGLCLEFSKYYVIVFVIWYCPDTFTCFAFTTMDNELWISKMNEPFSLHFLLHLTLLKNLCLWGAWVVQLVQRLTLFFFF